MSAPILRSLRTLRLTAALLVILSPFAPLRAGSAQDLSAQLVGQSFLVTPDTAAATLGDPVTVRFRIRFHERDQALDSVPQVVGALPPGVRVLSVEKLTRSPSRIYEGSARLAFYRPGRRPVPTFGLPFMRIVEGVSRATLASDSAFVDITPLLPPGNPALKDIQELEHRPASPLPLVALALALAAAAASYSLYRRRRRPPIALPTEPPVEPIVPPTPYQTALDRLDAVERERWPSRANVAGHFEAVAQTLREYLVAAENVGACERTTTELLWALPPYLTRAGLRDRCHDVLAEADLVKFARMQPDEAGAADFLRRARLLLTAWHEARPAEESVDALR
ncbi:MAG: hypothetical protein ABI037_10980 [Gemmatimonadales bacterium]